MTPTAKSNGNGAPDRVGPVSLTRYEGPSELSPHERLRELTAILANGIHRLHTRTPASPERHEIPSESSPTALEAAARTCPDGPGRQPKRTPET
jgi:hypothetical protein